MAPPDVAPGTSAVPACAHKEDKDARKLLRAGRMSGTTWQPCPLHWGARPHPNQNDMSASGQRYLPASCLFTRAMRGQQMRQQSPRSRAESTQRSVRKSAERKRRRPGRTAFAVLPERRNWADFSGANLKAMSLRCHARSALCPKKWDSRSKLYNTDIGIKLLARRIWRRVAHWKCGPKDRCAGVKNV